MGGKFSHKLDVLLPWILLNWNFPKENWHYSHAGWENFGAKIFSKLLLGQCMYCCSAHTCGKMAFLPDCEAHWVLLNRRSEKLDFKKKCDWLIFTYWWSACWRYPIWPFFVENHRHILTVQLSVYFYFEKNKKSCRLNRGIEQSDTTSHILV